MQDTPEADGIKSKSFNPGLVHTWECSQEEQRIPARDRQKGKVKKKQKQVKAKRSYMRKKNLETSITVSIAEKASWKA